MIDNPETSTSFYPGEDQQIEFRYVQANGLRLHTAQAGPQGGPLVVLLHGFPEFWYGWRNQILPLAAAGWRVVAPDQRGYNLSDKPSGVEHYAISNLVNDVLGLADALGKQKFALVGHDWGAAVGWETAIRFPERVEKLAILNVPHPDVMTQTLQNNWEQRRRSWYILAFQMPGLPETMLQANDWERAAEILQRSRSPGAFTAEEIEQYRQAWRQKDAMTCMIHWYRAAFRRGIGGVLRRKKASVRRVVTPTLMLWGEQDVALSKGMAQMSIELCDQGELVYYPNATHWLQHDEAQAVNERLMGFLKSPQHIPRYNDAHAK